MTTDELKFAVQRAYDLSHEAMGCIKIIERTTAAGDHVWIVIESAEVETGFRTEAEAKSYRAALYAYNIDHDHRLFRSVEKLRRSATITYNRS